MARPRPPGSDGANKQEPSVFGMADVVTPGWIDDDARGMTQAGARRTSAGVGGEWVDKRGRGVEAGVWKGGSV